jgi:hypothetical protein
MSCIKFAGLELVVILVLSTNRIGLDIFLKFGELYRDERAKDLVWTIVG